MKSLRNSLAANAQYLDMIQDLCSQNGCELVLVKVPVRTTKSYSGYWGPEKHAVIQEMADQRGIRFLDLNDEDIGLDWSTDTPDGGQHMNAKGAEKVSVFLSRWMKANYGLGDRRSADWDRSWDVQAQLYDYEAQYTDMQIQTDPLDYMQQLKEENRTVFVAVCQGSGEYWTEELQDRFGPIPPEAQTLLNWHKLRIDATERGILSISVRDNRLLIETSHGLLRLQGRDLPVLRSRDPNEQFLEIHNRIKGI
ncbi:MAG: hypothetical protein IJJ26_00785 [Victivallales bacterium]|nr:hypothetical protein [Victivallales bacterium]